MADDNSVGHYRIGGSRVTLCGRRLEYGDSYARDIRDVSCQECLNIYRALRVTATARRRELTGGITEDAL